jgi:hypothetical protein
VFTGWAQELCRKKRVVYTERAKRPLPHKLRRFFAAGLPIEGIYRKNQIRIGMTM